MKFETPIGPAWAAIDETGALTAFGFGSNAEEAGYSEEVDRQVREYFDGTRTTFDLRLNPRGTAFQHQVWAELCRIPHGETISYVELARRVGNPNASRAVGRANATNPIALVVPCHRVVGADGTLTGYAGGIEIKRWLLDFERGTSLFR